MDGRIQRWQRTHKAMIAAALELVVELEDLPSAQAIAERAGVTKRTVFDHFPDLASLFSDAADHQQYGMWSGLTPPEPGEGFTARLKNVIEQRARLFEEVGPVRRVAARLAKDHEKLAEMMASSRKALRQHLAIHLEPEIGGLSPAAVEAVHAVATFEVWEVLRRQQGLTLSRATATVEAAIEAVVAAARVKEA
jgi:TetR/AcrR family transcriptional regulator of autoinduction and epiphytic fitness